MLNEKTLAGIIITSSIINPLSNLEIINTSRASEVLENSIDNTERDIELAEKEKLKILESYSSQSEYKLKELRRIENVDFDIEDVRVPSGLKTSELRTLLGETNMKSLAPAFIDAESVYGVNALILTGLVALESGWNTSRRAVDNNNLTGYAVYSDTSKGKHFSSAYECIMETARLLKADYLSEEGSYYNGYSLKSINNMYSSDKTWYKKINYISKDLLNKYKELFLSYNDDTNNID